MHLYNVHCKQIVFGAPTDNGYASFLSSFLIDPEVSSRIRVLEAQRFTFEWREILPKFKHTEFKDIFRNDPLRAVRNVPRLEHLSPKGPPEKRKNSEDDLHLSKRQKKLRSKTSLNVLEQKPLNNFNAGTPLKAPTVIGTTSSDDCLEVGITAEEVKAALQSSSDEYLPIAPSMPDFDLVLRRTEEKLGLTPDFWEHYDWKSRSRAIIQEAINLRKVRASLLASRLAA